MLRRIVAISDFCSRVPPEPPAQCFADHMPPKRVGPYTAVGVGYVERLPLAAVRSGLVEAAEVWSFAGSDAHPTGLVLSPHGITERRFGIWHPMGPPIWISEFGAPEVLCVWGLGVTEEILLACRKSVVLYNSLDVDAQRIPAEVIQTREKRRQQEHV